jgi:tetratricopeptide (TPR) repeat protein
LKGARAPAAALLAAAVMALSGCAQVDSLRREFVGLRYLQTAEQRLARLPLDRARATHELDRALTLLPDHPTVRSRAGPLYAQAGAYQKALPLLAETPDGTQGAEARGLDSTMLLAQCLLQTGQRERGAEICRKEIARALKERRGRDIGTAEFAMVMNDAGYMLADASIDLPRAAAAIKQALDLSPLQPAFVDSMGWVRLRQGRFKEAAFYLERAVRLAHHENPEMLYHLGVAYARLGRIGEAEKALERARYLDPGYEEVQAELRRLGRELPPPGLALAPGGRHADTTQAH